MKVKLCDLFLVVDSNGFIQTKQWSQCTEAERKADSTTALEDLLSHVKHEFNVADTDHAWSND